MKSQSVRGLQRTLIFAALGAITLAVAACGGQQAPQQPAAETQAPASAPAPKAGEESGEAVAVLAPTEGYQARGRVTFRQDDEGVHVVAELSGLTPGNHGFHIHEFGDCSAPDASSAGGHFNPQGTPHGSPDNEPNLRHVGDLGNIEADADGNGFYERVDSVISLYGDDSIIGKSVIVHADPDDLVSQPSGNAGPRIACGVIEWVEPGGASKGESSDPNP